MYKILVNYIYNIISNRDGSRPGIVFPAGDFTGRDLNTLQKKKFSSSTTNLTK